jgi:hypothetical protein
VTANATTNGSPTATNALVFIVQCTAKHATGVSCTMVVTYADVMGVSCTNANDHQH